MCDASLSQCSQTLRAISEATQLFGIQNSESHIFGSGYAGLGFRDWTLELGMALCLRASVAMFGCGKRL